MITLKKHIVIAIGYFFIVALLGVLLRLFYVIPLPFNYRFIVHAHSHTALLGWIYLGLTTIIYKVYLQESSNEAVYRRLFFLTNVCIFGMLITFPFQGYALYSIIFSTLFLFASYYFAWFAFNNVSEKYRNTFSWKIVKAALYYLVLSSLGPWMIGAVTATLGTESIWYKNAIYFYLHFQYNGWFILALLGFFFYVLEQKDLSFNQKNQKQLFLLLQISIVMTLFLSVLWSKPPIIYNILGGIGAIIQIFVFWKLTTILREPFQKMKICMDRNCCWLLNSALILLFVKLFLQMASALPFIAELALKYKDFVIGYLHLVLLGVVVNTMLVFLSYFQLLKITRNFVFLYLFAFFSTEILIFYKGLAFWLHLNFLPSYYHLLAGLSCLFPLAVGLLFFKSIKNFYLSK